ncbi:Hypothetical protein [Arabidopsis thaliana]|uniref:T6H22.12 protein n=1 Tax=Arabidopsis thaliana TaxID=3702 RepID=Q9SGT5_ARATH|nr:Hypothetical protein [Arabidopsis thaliana]
MSQSGGDFNLSDEILAVIPTDPYDQLDLARKITSMAIASRVSNLESQVSGLRQKLLEKDRLVHELEDRVSSFERLYHEADSSLKNVVDENMKLTQERDSLAITAKKLGRDYAKQTETADVRMVPRGKVSSRVACSDVIYSVCIVDENSNGSYSNNEGLSEARQRQSMTPQFSPAFTPSGTPKILSTAASPRSYSAASSPKLFSGAASPTSSHYDIRMWSSTSQQSSVANSPPRSHSVSGAVCLTNSSVHSWLTSRNLTPGSRAARKHYRKQRKYLERKTMIFTYPLRDFSQVGVETKTHQLLSFLFMTN